MSKHEERKPVGAPPRALSLHKEQALDANETAHDMEENAEHLLADLRTFALDETFSRAEVRHARGHAALQHQLAVRQCSILTWAWASLVQIERLIEGYRLRQQIRKGSVGREIKVSQKKKAARQSGPNVQASQE